MIAARIVIGLVVCAAAAPAQCDGFAGVVTTVEGRPVAGALVSVRTSGQRPVASGRTDEDGRFEIEAAKRHWFAIEVEAEGFAPVDHSEARHGEWHEFVLFRQPTLDERFVHLVTVVGEDGEPVEDVEVGLARVAPRGVARWRVVQSQTTDEKGRAALVGGRAGACVLFADPRPFRLLSPIDGFPSWERIQLEARNRRRARVEVERNVPPGESSSRVVVPDGKTIRGRIEWVSPAMPFMFASAIGEREDVLGFAVHPPDRSSFEIEGLRDRAYTIEFDGGASVFRLAGVQAGTDDLVVKLKAFDDPRDHGLHLGEIHGRVLVGGVPVDGLNVVAESVDGGVRRPSGERKDGCGAAAFWPPGAFHVVGLEAGDYVLRVRRDGEELGRAGPFRVGDRQVLRDVTVKVD